ncbi:serine hydrolase [Aliiglaciecola sp. CAU 1673]|uniref:serine hydrolase domain-containing protein n=1 Tax=Aliiglaciecola sp. CAU 1673 TaxID=3032595 RepID=UPI0023DA076B|nr:serine hydrolase [Aliiglaciecola sp. CAU 1673]MDF2176933.1 serine hydrolase [Aliiglaciecola sp. CAU 1673]
MKWTLINTKHSSAMSPILLLLFVLSACGGSTDGSNVETPGGIGENSPPTPYSYQVPTSANDGWQTAHLADFGINDYALSTMMDRIRQNQSGYRHIDHILIVKDNKLLFDERIRTQLDSTDHRVGNQDIDVHTLYSVTKSIASALIGIAIDQGVISDVEIEVHQYFGHKQPIANWNDAKASIRLKDWLTMRHGYQWDEWDGTDLLGQMNSAPDPLAFLLNRPMSTEPGTTFAYSTGVSYALGTLLELTSGQTVDSFLEQNLLSPLGIEKYNYWTVGGQLHTGGALYLTARDLAKIGQLFLNKGNWQGEQVISTQWVEESTRRHVDLQTSGYGYQWWTSDFMVNGQSVPTYRGEGLGGQHLIVLPTLNAVVVILGRAYNYQQQQEYRWDGWMLNHILPSLLQAR